MADANDGWEDVSDPAGIQAAQAYILPSAPPKKGRAGGGGGPTADDRKTMQKYRDADDQATQLGQDAQNFLSRADRFHTGSTKATLFDAMYPSGDGWTGPLKRAGGAILRGTLGQLYSDQDHADYQYLTGNAQALNNAALRLNKGVQTEGDAVRIAKENVGVDKTPQVNRDLFNGNERQAMALAHARNASAAKWIGAFGTLTGSKNAHGQTYDEWFNTVVRPQAMRQAQAQAHPTQGGWSISR